MNKHTDGPRLNAEAYDIRLMRARWMAEERAERVIFLVTFTVLAILIVALLIGIFIL